MYEQPSSARGLGSVVARQASVVSVVLWTSAGYFKGQSVLAQLVGGHV